LTCVRWNHTWWALHHKKSPPTSNPVSLYFFFLLAMHAQISRITDILRRDDGISWAMHYTEQISWILFLKFLDDYETSQELEATLNGTTYTRLLSPEFQRHTRASPKTPDGKKNILTTMVGDDLKEFVNLRLFPYLKAFRDPSTDYHSMKYKIGEIFYFLDNRIENGNTIRDVIDIIDDMSFQNQTDLFELSQIYEDLLQGMGNDGGNSGEFYTPRPVIKAMVQCLDPEIGQTIYDGATWSCGFLIESYTHLKAKVKTTQDLHRLNHDALWGNEKTPIAYILGVMNMILHGITNPNINKRNTLIDDIRQFEEKDGYDIIIANPPFGGKEKEAIQSNFPIKTKPPRCSFSNILWKSSKPEAKLRSSSPSESCSIPPMRLQKSKKSSSLISISTRLWACLQGYFCLTRESRPISSFLTRPNLPSRSDTTKSIQDANWPKISP